MTLAPHDDFKPLREKIRTLAHRHGGPDGAGITQTFPRDLWQALGRENLMGILIPETHQGLGLGPTSLAHVTEELVVSGATMGFALSFLIHNLVAHHFIHTHGTEELRDAYLPDLARGTITAAVAVSEPGAGAHPKHLKTRARHENGRVVIDGEKSFITNGPLADLFVVIAVTEKKENRKQYSAFVVPRDTPGLIPGAPMDFPVLRPCLHNTLTLKGCEIKATARTGEAHRAYETMVIPFRRLEQALGPVILSGGIQHRANTLGVRLKGRVPGTGLETMLSMAHHASRLAHKGVESPLSTAEEFFRCAKEFQAHVKQLIPPGANGKAETFDNDLNALLRLFPG